MGFTFLLPLNNDLAFSIYLTDPHTGELLPSSKSHHARRLKQIYNVRSRKELQKN